MTKKKATEELTDAAAIKRLFPPEAIKEAKQEVAEAPKHPKKPVKRSNKWISI